MSSQSTLLPGTSYQPPWEAFSHAVFKVQVCSQILIQTGGSRSVGHAVEHWAVDDDPNFTPLQPLQNYTIFFISHCLDQVFQRRHSVKPVAESQSSGHSV